MKREFKNRKGDVGLIITKTLIGAYKTRRRIQRIRLTDDAGKFIKDKIIVHHEFVNVSPKYPNV